MPVIGHAFAGYALAVAASSTGHGRRGNRPRSSLEAFRIPIILSFSYAPDIAAQILQWGGHGEARLVSHSLLFCLIFVPFGGIVLRAAGTGTFARSSILAAGCVALHLVLDMAQSTDRAPLWPWSRRLVDTAPFVIPRGLLPEFLVFGAAVLLVVLATRAARKASHASADAGPGTPTGAGVRIAARAAAAAIVAMAVFVNVLRDSRENDLERARILVEGGRYDEGLVLLERSERWPSPVKAGRAAYLRGVAHLGLGHPHDAEKDLLRAYSSDPTYIWVVGDLGLFYAQHGKDPGLRRKKAAPYLEALRGEFRGHEASERLARRIEAALAPPDSRSRSEDHAHPPGPLPAASR